MCLAAGRLSSAAHKPTMIQQNEQVNTGRSSLLLLLRQLVHHSVSLLITQTDAAGSREKNFMSSEQITQGSEGALPDLNKHPNT